MLAVMVEGCCSGQRWQEFCNVSAKCWLLSQLTHQTQTPVNQFQTTAQTAAIYRIQLIKRNQLCHQLVLR